VTMKTCDRIQSIFPRLVEGEADPGDALRVARHLGDCTVCKIVLARERRLAEVLGTLEDPLPVDEMFIEKVMAALPAGPPPATVGRVRRRLIRLAGLGALAAALGATAPRVLAGLGNVGIGLIRTGLDLEGGERLLRGLGAGARSVLLMLAEWGPLDSSRNPGPLDAAISPSILAFVTIALFGAAAFFGVTAWSAAKPASEAGARPEAS
jgi:hypothetical protein